MNRTIWRRWRFRAPVYLVLLSAVFCVLHSVGPTGTQQRVMALRCAKNLSLLNAAMELYKEDYRNGKPLAQPTISQMVESGYIPIFGCPLLLTQLGTELSLHTMEESYTYDAEISRFVCRHSCKHTKMFLRHEQEWRSEAFNRLMQWKEGEGSGSIRKKRQILKKTNSSTRSR